MTQGSWAVVEDSVSIVLIGMALIRCKAVVASMCAESTRSREVHVALEHDTVGCVSRSPCGHRQAPALEFFNWLCFCSERDVSSIPQQSLVRGIALLGAMCGGFLKIFLRSSISPGKHGHQPGHLPLSCKRYRVRSCVNPHGANTIIIPVIH